MMAELDSVLQVVRLLVFAATGLAGLRLWTVHRNLPAAFLAAAFGTLSVTLAAAWVVPSPPVGGWQEFARDAIVVGLAVFAWLLACFAWSFEPRRPRWLTAVGVGVAAMAVWLLVLPPLPAAGEPRSPGQTAFVMVFIALWVALTLITAAKLWRSGGAQPLVRGRMRLMAGGAFLLAVALLVVGSVDRSEAVGVAVAIDVVTIASAVLFVASFAPPRALRMWWRRRATAQWSQMQLDLIAAATPQEVAAAALPVVADVLGAGATVITSEGEPLASARLTPDELEAICSRIDTPGRRRSDETWVEVADAWLVVRSTAYTPLFGPDERDLLAGFALQLRLALERARWFESSEHARAELERAGKETREMMTGLAHDLSGPVASIKGYTDLVRDVDQPEERDQMLDRINANAAHLDRLLKSLGELSRAGRTQTQREHVDLEEIVDRVTLRMGAAHPDATVEAGPLPRVFANPLAMEQVFENLLVNAAKHGGRQDITIRITAETSPDAVVINVVDNGEGIPTDEHDAVFAPFRRGRNTSAEGSGVGLGLVRRIIESHDGTITLRSTGPGAHFHICLPRPAEPTARQPATSASSDVT